LSFVCTFDEKVESVDPEASEGDEGLFERAVAAAATTTAHRDEATRAIIICFRAAGRGLPSQVRSPQKATALKSGKTD
jgi:hypothetical protein